MTRPSNNWFAGQEFVVDGGVTKKMVYPEEEEEGGGAGAQPVQQPGA